MRFEAPDSVELMLCGAALVVLGVLTLMSCAPPPDPALCVTKCGVRYQGDYPSGDMSPGFTCEELQRAEDRVLSAAHLVRDPRFVTADNVCKAVKGWNMWTHTQECWTDSWGRGVCGMTECWSGRFQVGAARTPSASSFAHEVAHVVQRCTPRGKPDPRFEDDDHIGWSTNGIYDYITQAQERP